MKKKMLVVIPMHPNRKKGWKKQHREWKLFMKKSPGLAKSR